MRERLADARYLLSDVLFQIGRLPRAAGRGVARGWLALPLSWRRGIAAAVAGAAAVVLVALVARPALPCGWPGAEACQPTDEAIALVPDDALLYASVFTDADYEQFSRAVDLVAELPQLSRQAYGRVLAALPGPGGAPPTIEVDLAPWVGDQIAVAVLPDAGRDPAEVVLLEVGEPEGAELYAESVAIGETERVERGGHELLVDTRGVATAQLEEFLVVGPREGVERVVELGAREGVVEADAADEEPGEADAPAEEPDELDETDGPEAADEDEPEPGGDGAEAQAGSLAEHQEARAAIGALEEPRLATAYLSPRGARLLTGPGATLAALEPFIDEGSTEGAAVALRMEGDGALELTVSSTLGEDGEAGFFSAFPAFEPSLDDRLMEGTLAYVGFGDPAETVAQLVEQAAGTPGLGGALGELGEGLAAAARGELTELLASLGGEAALAVQPGGELEPPREDDPEAPGDEDERDAEAAATGEDEPPEGPDAAAGDQPAGEPLAPELEGLDALAEEAPIPLLSLLVDGVDPESLEAALAEVETPLARALTPDDAEARPSFRSIDVDGIETRTIRLTPVIDLAMAVVGETLAVATSPVAVQRVERGAGGLAGSERFARATEGLTRTTSFIGYLDLAGLIAVAEREGLAMDPLYAPFAEDFRRLEALGLSVASDGERLTSGLRLTLVR